MLILVSLDKVNHDHLVNVMRDMLLVGHGPTVYYLTPQMTDYLCLAMNASHRIAAASALGFQCRLIRVPGSWSASTFRRNIPEAFPDVYIREVTDYYRSIPLHEAIALGNTVWDGAAYSAVRAGQHTHILNRISEDS